MEYAWKELLLLSNISDLQVKASELGQDQSPDSALVSCAAVGDQNGVALALARGAQWSAHDYAALLLASAGGHDQVLACVPDFSRIPSEVMTSCMMAACIFERMSVARDLLCAGAPMDWNGASATCRSRGTDIGSFLGRLIPRQQPFSSALA